MTHTNNITVDYAGYQSVGYGQKKINVSLVCDGNIKNFTDTTNNIHGFDAATDLDGQERYDALYDLIRHQIANQVQEWIHSI